ncbi:MAG: BrnA antitoxin family protein [Acetobacteraceae bacterium]
MHKQDPPHAGLPSASPSLERLNEDVIEWFKRQAGTRGGYQTAMNRTLRAAMLHGLRLQAQDQSKR